MQQNWLRVFGQKGVRNHWLKNKNTAVGPAPTMLQRRIEEQPSSVWMEELEEEV